MKKLLLLSTLFFLNYNVCQAQWVQTKGPTGTTVASILAVGTNTFVGTSLGGVLLSANNGNAWTRVNSGLTLSQLTALDTIGSTLFVGTVTGVFSSSNNGATWTTANTGLAPRYVLAFARQGTTIYAGTDNGIFISNNSGASWSASGLSTSKINALTVFKAVIFAGTNNGVFVSTNNGVSWTAVNSGLTTTYVTSLKSAGTKLYAGTQNGFFLSLDTAKTWTAAGLANTTINCLTLIGNYIFAGTDTSLYSSLDNGATWVEKKAGLPAKAGGVVALSGANGRLFAGLRNGLGMFTSNDYGTTWNDINAGIPNQYINAVAIKGTTIFAGAAGYHSLFISADNGNTWASPVNDTLSSASVLSFAISDSTIFAGTGGVGIFKSTNNGVSWHASNSGLGSSIYSLTASNHIIYAGTYGYIYRSVNDGASWNIINPGMTTTSPQVQSIVVNGSMIYAGTAGEGVFRSNNSGGSWTAVNTGLSDLNVTSLNVHGDTVLAGTYNSGVFISIDKGTSWLPFNLGINGTHVTAFADYGNTVFACTAPGGLNALAGNKWAPANSGLVTPNVSSIAISSNNVVIGTFGSSVWKNLVNANIISGIVKVKAGAVNSGYAKLYHYKKDAHMPLADSVQIDLSGTYIFHNLFPGSYVAYANASSSYPLTTSTYCDSTAQWDSAIVMTVTLGTSIIKNIKLVEFPVPTGKGKITGRIVKGSGFQKRTIGDPIPGIDISLGKRPKPSQTIISHTTTNSKGDYVFDKLSTGDYVVLVDIPGLSKDSYNISISATDTVFTNLNYIVDSAKIRIDSIATSIHSLTISGATIKIYPNPFKQQTFIDLELSDNGPVEIILYNSIGQRISTIENSNLSKGHHQFDLAVSAKGVYLVTFNIKGQYSSYRIIEIE
jgi:hypothetical protein